MPRSRSAGFPSCYLHLAIQLRLAKSAAVSAVCSHAPFDAQEDALDTFTKISRERLERTFHVNILAMFRLAQKVCSLSSITEPSTILHVLYYYDLNLRPRWLGAIIERQLAENVCK